MVSQRGGLRGLKLALVITGWESGGAPVAAGETTLGELAETLGYTPLEVLVSALRSGAVRTEDLEATNRARRDGGELVLPLVMSGPMAELLLAWSRGDGGDGECGDQ